MTRKASTVDHAPTTFRIEESTGGYSKLPIRTFYINQATLKAIEAEIADTHREDWYGNSQEAAERDRAHFVELRKRGATHTAGWSNEIRVVFRQSNYGASEGVRWVQATVSLPEDISGMREGAAMFEVISKRLVKATGDSWEAWNNPDALVGVLVKLGAVAVINGKTSSGRTEYVQLARGLTELKPLPEQLEIAAE